MGIKWKLVVVSHMELLQSVCLWDARKISFTVLCKLGIILDK
jgi:hypothetical protein